MVDPSPEDADLDTKIRCRRRATATWLLGFATREKTKRALEAADLAWADIRSPYDAVRAPTAVARGVVAEVDDRGGGRRRVVQSPYRFSDAASGVRGPAPFRGEHNAEVLGQWLGLGDSDVGAGVLQAE